MKRKDGFYGYYYRYDAECNDQVIGLRMSERPLIDQEHQREGANEQSDTDVIDLYLPRVRSLFWKLSMFDDDGEEQNDENTLWEKTSEIECSHL